MTHKYMRLTTRRHKGFALVMTLLLIAIAGVAMGVVARNSLSLATRAESEQSQLQHEWGTRSIQRTLAPAALEVLALAESQSDLPLIQYQTQFDLNGLTFHLVFGDEQAKTNLNTLLAQRSELDARDAIKDLVQDRRAGLSLQLDPLPADITIDSDILEGAKREDTSRNSQQATSGAEDQITIARLGCFEQVWSAARPDKLIQIDSLENSWTSHVTLWGDGRVHFNRASAESVYRAAQDHLTRRDVEYMMVLRDTTPALGIERALHGLDPKINRQSERLIGHGLTERSRCQSLWVVVDAGRRTHYHLAVIVNNDQAGSATNTSQAPSFVLMDW